MRSSEDLARQRHYLLKPSVASLKLWLVLGDEPDNFDGCRPGVLNKRSILNLDVEATQTSPDTRLDVILVDVVNTAVAGWLWGRYVVVFVGIIPSSVIKACLVKSVAEGVKVVLSCEDEPTSSYVVHPGELHRR